MVSCEDKPLVGPNKSFVCTPDNLSLKEGIQLVFREKYTLSMRFKKIIKLKEFCK